MLTYIFYSKIYSYVSTNTRRPNHLERAICTQNVMTLKYVVEEYTRNSQQGGADKFLMLLESR